MQNSRWFKILELKSILEDRITGVETVSKVNEKLIKAIKESSYKDDADLIDLTTRMSENIEDSKKSVADGKAKLDKINEIIKYHDSLKPDEREEFEGKLTRLFEAIGIGDELLKQKEEPKSIVKEDK